MQEIAKLQLRQLGINLALSLFKRILDLFPNLGIVQIIHIILTKTQ